MQKKIYDEKGKVHSENIFTENRKALKSLAFQRISSTENKNTKIPQTRANSYCWLWGSDEHAWDSQYISSCVVLCNFTSFLSPYNLHELHVLSQKIYPVTDLKASAILSLSRSKIIAIVCKWTRLLTSIHIKLVIYPNLKIEVKKLKVNESIQQFDLNTDLKFVKTQICLWSKKKNTSNVRPEWSLISDKFGMHEVSSMPFLFFFGVLCSCIVVTLRSSVSLIEQKFIIPSWATEWKYQ